MVYTVFPPGDSWTGEDEFQAFVNVFYPGYSIVLALNAFGLVTFYAFAKNRTFPVTVLGWIAILNSIYAIFMVAKWTPNSVSAPAIQGATGSLSSFSYWMDVSYEYGLCTLNVLVSLVLFLTIRMHKDLEYESDPRYFWGFLGFFALVIIVAPIAIVMSPNVRPLNSGSASGLSGNTQWGEIAPLLLMIAFQLFCVASSLRQAKKL